MTGPKIQVSQLLAPLLATLLLLPVRALAHHSAAHGPSESLRVLGTLGTNAAPRQRAVLIAEATQSSSEPALSNQRAYSLSALVDFQLTPRLFLGGLLPFGVVDEELADSPKVGLGNLRLGAQYELSRMRQPDEPSLALSLSLVLPTRSVAYEVDAGWQWIVTPGFRYADHAGKILWYGLVSVPVETRPAGSASDLSIAAGLGYQVAKPLSLSLALSADVRWLNVCTEGPDLGWCHDGRTTEAHRPVGATRLYLSPTVTVDLTKRWSLFSSGQLPLLPRRDLEWLVSLGGEFRF